MMECQKNLKVRCILSDNGTEYVFKEFDDFLKEKGIKRKLTVPYTPQQNCVIERHNRTLMKMARWLIQSKLPETFWAEAVNAAAYIRNRCPTRSLGGKTPFELWNGRKPNVKHFREFGSRVWCLDKRPNKNKLSSKSVEGIFVGYSEESKGYRIWLSNEKTLIVSRDRVTRNYCKRSNTKTRLNNKQCEK